MKRTLLCALLTGQVLAQPGLHFEQIPDQDKKAPSTPMARTLPLSLADVGQLLMRLPELQRQLGDVQPFAFRQSLPPPRAGQRIEQAFPPAAAVPRPSAAEVKPIEVLSRSPEGEVELAPQVSMTFNQPMPPDSRPAKLTPAVPGEWRWVGTQTLVFQPQKRLPMATEFQVEVQAEKPVHWTFGTPPPQLKTSYPNRGKVTLQPVIYLEFNQRVDPQKALSFVSLDGQSLRPASAQEIAGDKKVSELVKAAQPDTWLALVPVEPLPRGSVSTVRLRRGLTSLEGPRPTAQTQQFSFVTYAPLQMDAGPPSDEPPGTSVPISFTNDLAEQEVQVSAQPEIPELRARVSGGNLWISGKTRGRSHYQLTLPAGIRDRFGQQTDSPIVVELSTGPATPRFVSPRKDFLILDPSGPPQLFFEVVNHQKLWVQVRAVKVSDWKAYQRGGRYGDSAVDAKLPGEVVLEQEIDTGARPDEAQQVRLDLSRALEKSNQLLVIARPVGVPEKERHRAYHGWVQRTGLGVNLAVEAERSLVWVNRLSDGSSVADAEVRFLGTADTAKTGAEGLATLPCQSGHTDLLIQRGDDQLFWPSSHWSNRNEGDRTLWSINDDRKIYKPGETVSLKGWLRREIHQPRGGINLPTERTLSYKLRDRNGTTLTEGTCAIERLGSFQFQVKLPKQVELGSAHFELSAGGKDTDHEIRIDEFRAPEFEVSARAASSTAVIGGTGSLSVDANYFAGGGLKNSPVHWEVEAEPSSYSPPHWDGYTFGYWRPWWDFAGWQERDENRVRKTFTGVTDARGKDTLDLKFLSADEPRPYALEATATLSDANRQTWTSSTTMLVHPANLYVGLKAQRTFVEAGQPLEYQLVVTDLEGKLVSGRSVQLKVFEEEWSSKKREVHSQQLTSASQPLKITLPLTRGGSYLVEATVSDENNRSNRSSLSSWIAGGAAPPPSRKVGLEKLSLIPNQKLYQPGEVAEILVMSPFPEGQALVTLERHGLASHQMLPISQGQATLKVPLDEDFLPNLHVTVDAVGKAPRGADVPDRPAQARAELNLEISKAGRELSVDVRASQPTVRPGASNQLEVTLKDAQGKPVSQSDVALLVVDESVLALSGRGFSNPFAAFYRDRPADVSHAGMRDQIELALAEEIVPSPPPAQVLWTSASGAAGATNVTFAENYRELNGSPLHGGSLMQVGPFEAVGNAAAGIGAFQGGISLGVPAFPLPIGTGKKSSEKIRLRKDFSPLAFYLPNARTNAAGQFRAPFKLPDNLTRYRVVALAAAGETLFGKGESSLVAQQPLMVRPSPPRFLNLGDRCELPVLVQNQTDKPLAVDMACRATNLKLDPARAGVHFTVPANDRVEVRFPVSADLAGTGRLQLAVSSGDFADAATVTVPVLTPATSEAFATYGTIDQGAVTQPIVPPQDVFPEFGGLEVSTSSTALSELTDAILYLRKYPYECSEQISSRVLSTVALEPVLRAFQSKDLPGPEQLKLSLKADIDKLERQQNSDGGWDYWKRGEPSVPYVSLHVAHTLVRLRQAGYAVADDVYDKALHYVSSIDEHIPSEYPRQCRPPLQAYALSILKRAGRPDPQRARRLLEGWGGVEKTPLECLGWILPTLSKQPEAAAIRRHLNNRVSQTAATAQFTTSYGDGAYLVLSSDHRDDAVILEALIQDSPESELLPKLVRGLLGQRIAGRWESTQENCFVLLALHQYFQKFEKIEPNFMARLWLGPRYAGEQAFRGRSADSKELRVPISQIGGPTDLLLAKEGAGRLYYRVGMKYAPLSLQLPALERGFTVERSYEATEDNRDVVRAADGSWHIKAGARVKVTLSMAAPAERYQVALVDPLPAGLEAINPALKGSQKAETKTGPSWNWWSPYWYNHENLRDDRVEAFASWLHGGFYTYSYYARATTPGQFIVPPAKAEEMYHPETFGRCASDRVSIED